MSFFIYCTSNPRTKLEKRLDKIWNSGDKRYKCPIFRCDFCDKKYFNSSYSVVDGGMSCLKCDGKDSK